jgi:hypothetical protein
MLEPPSTDYVNQNPPPLPEANAPKHQEQGEIVETILSINGECAKLQETNSESGVEGDSDVLMQSMANGGATGEHHGPQTSHVSVNALELSCFS